MSFLRQLFILSARNIKILTRDWFSLFLLLVTAPIMASLDFMVASGIGHDPFGFKSGNFNDVIVTMIVFTTTTMLVGGLSFMRGLVKQRDIYKRERMVNLKLSSYIMSKIWVAILLAVPLQILLHPPSPVAAVLDSSVPYVLACVLFLLVLIERGHEDPGGHLDSRKSPRPERGTTFATRYR